MFASTRTIATRSIRSISTTVAVASESSAVSGITKAQQPIYIEAQKALPKSYFVERTSNGQLPVYSEFKNAGNRPLTTIRKISGNVQALKSDLLTTYPGAEVRVNERSNQVILKGLVMDDVRQWLAAKGF